MKIRVDDFWTIYQFANSYKAISDSGEVRVYFSLSALESDFGTVDFK
jgi:hypothetical protein